MPSTNKKFDELCANYVWQIPDKLNVAQLTCSRHADGTGRLALIAETESGSSERYSFDDIELLSNQLANAFSALGIKQGDCIWFQTCCLSQIQIVPLRRGVYIRCRQTLTVQTAVDGADSR